MTNFTVEARNVSKRYRRQTSFALEGITLSVGAGEIVAVIGHNGAGKSTLFDIVGGLMKPTSGTVSRGVGEARIGWCPQREIVDWSLTVRQNILLGADLRLQKFHKGEAVESVAEILGLSQYLDRTAETLSGGELRRTQIGRALIGNPALIILDEPTTGLDPEGITVVFEHLRAAAAAGATVLVSTHETSRFAKYCSRVIALQHGCVIADQDAKSFAGLGADPEDLWSAFRAVAGSAEGDEAT